MQEKVCMRHEGCIIHRHCAEGRIGKRLDIEFVNPVVDWASNQQILSFCHKRDGVCADNVWMEDGGDFEREGNGVPNALFDLLDGGGKEIFERGADVADVGLSRVVEKGLKDGFGGGRTFCYNCRDKEGVFKHRPFGFGVARKTLNAVERVDNICKHDLINSGGDKVKPLAGVCLNPRFHHSSLFVVSLALRARR